MVSSTSVSISAGYNVEELREKQFPLTRDTVYLNHAAVSPIPRRTFEAIQAVNERLLLDPSGNFEVVMARFAAFLETLRAHINAQYVEEIIGVSSTSVGLNLVAQAMTWQRGDNIVLCDMEFPSNVYPWMRLQTQYGVEAKIIPNQDGGLTLEALEKVVDAHTHLVTVSTVQFFTGHLTDLMAIGAFCHERGILLAVDAIQSAGHIPIDVQAMHIDILAAGGHKSLMGAPGQGFLYVRKDLAEQLHPTMVSADGVVDYSHWLQYKLTPQAGAARFRTGTTNSSGIAGLLESVSFLREIGISAIDRYVTALADYAIDHLNAAGFSVITPRNLHGPIVTFRAAESETATDALVAEFRRQRIFVTKHWDRQNVAHIRISLHCYNNPADIDRFLSVLKENVK